MKLKNLKLVLFVSAVIFIVSFCYTLARRFLVEGAAINKSTGYVFNSSLAFTSAILIAASFLSWEIRQKKFFGLVGLCFAAVHAFVSLRLFDLVPVLTIFVKSGKITFDFELAVLCGIFAICIFLALSFIHNKMFAFAGLVFLIWHVFIMGYESWLKVAGWPGHLPPITSLALMALALIFVRGFFYSGKGNI
jgi:hypothetical protein